METAKISPKVCRWSILSLPKAKLQLMLLNIQTMEVIYQKNLTILPKESSKTIRALSKRFGHKRILR